MGGRGRESRGQVGEAAGEEDLMETGNTGCSRDQGSQSVAPALQHQ